MLLDGFRLSLALWLIIYQVQCSFLTAESDFFVQNLSQENLIIVYSDYEDREKQMTIAAGQLLLLDRVKFLESSDVKPSNAFFRLAIYRITSVPEKQMEIIHNQDPIDDSLWQKQQRKKRNRYTLMVEID